ncbi:HmuY family protein [Mucilaginibacter defluvii]|uniref:HmuY family protein n=1 Tax=Mucilaginibacter defluvii TaxID=1196019 RepID=A0ABP9FT56_9SPHI
MKLNRLIKLRSIVSGLALVVGLSACTKEQVKPVLADGRSTVVADLPGDVGNTVGSGKPFTPFYFSFTTNTKVDSSEKKTTKWDIAFAKEYNSYVSINNGTNQSSFGLGGPGKGALIAVNQSYDKLTTAPSDEEFAKNGITAAGWDSGNGNGWYFYDIKTHIAIPVKNRTYVLRTADGKFAKLEMVSMYEGAPAVVTDITWPAPYFTFRYYVQQDGSRNLSTKDQ